MQKILIVEDDIDIQDILKNHLIDAGYEVAVASDGVAGIAMFDDTIDLVLLDIMLPKIDGYGVCEVIRKRSQVPIIMLTALSDEENQLRGFEQQIDDYIPKPFSPKILLCKIAAILRRRTVETQNQSLLTYKELSMDVDGFHVYQGGNEVVLTSKEFALLRLMLENQGKVFTRQMLLDRLWEDDLEVEDRIIDSHIKNIRKKLNADYIKTIRGVGYRVGKRTLGDRAGAVEESRLHPKAYLFFRTRAGGGLSLQRAVSGKRAAADRLGEKFNGWTCGSRAAGTGQIGRLVCGAYQSAWQDCRRVCGRGGPRTLL